MTLLVFVFHRKLNGGVSHVSFQYPNRPITFAVPENCGNSHYVADVVCGFSGYVVAGHEHDRKDEREWRLPRYVQSSLPAREELQALPVDAGLPG